MEEFVALLQEHLDRLHGKRYYNVGYDTNKKWIRVWAKPDCAGSGESVYMFVEKSTGDAYAPKSWSQRAKHVRGNINDPEPLLKKCGQWGMEHLRSHLNR